MRVIAAALTASVMLAACNYEDETRRFEAMNADYARHHPPSLWSIAVVGERDNGRPVLICASERMILGFTTIEPFAGGRECQHTTDTLKTETGSRFKCRINAVEYAVSSAVSGDLNREFQVASSAYPVLDPGPQYARTLRFRHIGACPAGWGEGQATDQRGQLTTAFREESGATR